MRILFLPINLACYKCCCYNCKVGKIGVELNGTAVGGASPKKFARKTDLLIRQRLRMCDVYVFEE